MRCKIFCLTNTFARTIQSSQITTVLSQLMHFKTVHYNCTYNIGYLYVIIREETNIIFSHNYKNKLKYKNRLKYKKQIEAQKQIEVQNKLKHKNRLICNMEDVGKISTKYLPLSSTCHYLAETFCFSCRPPESLT